MKGGSKNERAIVKQRERKDRGRVDEEGTERERERERG